MESFDPKAIYLIFHLLGVALGAGGAFMSDALFLVTTKDKVLDKSEFRVLKTGSIVTWLGVIILLISGFLLFTLNTETYLASEKFIAKMIIVAILIINGIIFHLIHLPKLKSVVGKHLSSSKVFKDSSQMLYTSGVISVTSWVFTLVLGSLKSIPIKAWEVLILYTFVIVIGVIIAEWKRRRYLK